MQTEKYNGRELSRNSWWEPYAWESAGIGYNNVCNEDFSREYGIYRRKVNEVKFYGLKVENDFLAMRISLEFNDSKIVLDRAVHSPREMRLRNMKTFESKKITGMHYIPIFKKEKEYEANPFDTELPVKNANALEKTIEEYSGRTISQFRLIGNHTAAVGFLPNEVLIKFSGGKVLFAAHTYLSRGKTAEVLGKSRDLDGLCVLVVKGNMH